MIHAVTVRVSNTLQKFSANNRLIIAGSDEKDLERPDLGYSSPAEIINKSFHLNRIIGFMTFIIKFRNIRIHFSNRHTLKQTDK